MIHKKVNKPVQSGNQWFVIKAKEKYELTKLAEAIR